MPSYRLRALVLRKTKLGEADNIVTLLASDGRQVRAVAKGVRKTRSKFGARLEPFAVVDLLLASGRNLEIVQEAETVASHERLRADYDLSRHAFVIAELLDKASLEGQGEPVLFEMSGAALDALEAVPVGKTESADGLPLAVTAAFVVKAMGMLGYRPQLSACVECAEATEVSGFALDAGGVICRQCGETEAGVFPLRPGVLETLAALIGARFGELSALELPQPAVRECLVLLKAFAERQLQTRLKALGALLSDPGSA